MPGQSAWVRRVSGSKTSLIGAGGTIALRSGAVSDHPPASETYFTVKLVVAEDGDQLLANFLRRMARKDPAIHDWPAPICGSALLAWPALSRVATQVVRKFELKLGSALSRAAAAMSGGVARIACISAAVWPVSCSARFLK